MRSPEIFGAARSLGYTIGYVLGALHKFGKGGGYGVFAFLGIVALLIWSTVIAISYQRNHGQPYDFTCYSGNRVTFQGRTKGSYDDNSVTNGTYTFLDPSTGENITVTKPCTIRALPH